MTFLLYIYIYFDAERRRLLSLWHIDFRRDCVVVAFV